MKEIAFFPLRPLGDSIAIMGELEELHRLYTPCKITVFAIPLIAELYSNYKYCDEAVELDGGLHGKVSFKEVPARHFDIVFNHGYDENWTHMLRQMDYDEAYGMEEISRPAEECKELFTRWVPLDYWEKVVMKKWKFVSQQIAAIVRLLNPDYESGCPNLNEDTYRLSRPENMPAGKYALFLPGTSALLKYWPIQKYFLLAELLQRQGIEPVFVIGPQDRSLRDALVTSGYRFFERLSVSELAYCIRYAEIAVGNDMGPMHLAACFDIPTVHFFSFTGAHTWFQYNPIRHKVVMFDCGQRDGLHCGTCRKSCIGKISLRQAYNACRELLDLPELKWRNVGFFAPRCIGDALVIISELEELSRLYNPCEITVFTPESNAEMYRLYAFCDHVFKYTAGEWKKDELPSEEFEALFNSRYDLDSVKIIQSLNHRHAYGYEHSEIPGALCREVYDAWLPLSMWDDSKLRQETSVSEQGASLIRLVNPDYHLQASKLALNTFVHDLNVLRKIPKGNKVIIVRGASLRYKDWGTENYLNFAAKLKEHGFLPVFLLGPGETDYAEVTEAAGFKCLRDLNLSEVAGVLNPDCGGRCVVGNDTGIMHLACMLDVPSVTIFSGATYFTWFPYASPRHAACYSECAAVRCHMACQDAFKTSCIKRISLEHVWQAFEKVYEAIQEE